MALLHELALHETDVALWARSARRMVVESLTQFAGIDYDTHGVHLVLLDETGGATYHYFPLEGPDAFARTREVRDAMWPRTRWADEGVVALAIERPWGPNKGTLLPVLGAILSCLPAWLLIEPMEPSRWRSTVGLPGRASKQDVAMFALHRMLDHPPHTFPSEYRRSISFWPQDGYDAYCLALAASILVERKAA